MRRITSKPLVETLEYTIIRRPRVTKRMHMELDRQGGLVVVAPTHWSKRYIRTTLVKNIHRVERFLANARDRHTPPLRYVNGEQHYYLGESYQLAIHKMAAGKSHIVLVDGEIRINTPESRPEKIQTTLQNWYRHKAGLVFNERLAVIARRAPRAQDRTIPLKLRRMKRTWGNCSSKGVIKLNTHLVKAPLVIVDSVIVHEICHLEEMNHSKAFYVLLEKLNPGWRQDRARLRSDGFIYLAT